MAMDFQHREKSPCDLCGGMDFKPVWNRGHPGVFLPTVLCRTCGLVQTNPRPTREELSEFYAKDYRVLYSGAAIPNEHARQGMKAQARSRYAEVDHLLPAGSHVVEIGCATGEFLAELAAHGHVPVGIEASPECAALARATGAEVRAGLIEDQEFARGSFDSVCMFHVLEHLTSPRRSLGIIRQWLKPGGILFIEVPDVAQPYHGNLSRFFQIAHNWSYSAATLGALLQVAGYRPSWARRLVEGKFLRMIAVRPNVQDPVEIRFPTDGAERMQSDLRRWRLKWLLWYKWRDIILAGIALPMRIVRRITRILSGQGDTRGR